MENRMEELVTAVIVTHNSQKYLSLCVEALRKQVHVSVRIIVIDSGSVNTNYLEELKKADDISVVFTGNIGFSKGNNLGWDHCKNENGYTLFLNPDTFVSKEFIANGIRSLEDEKDSAIISGKLYGYDIDKKCVSERFDSTGIFRKWYGKWFDRGQNSVDRGQFNTKEVVPALCGALMLCKNKVLCELGDRIFDEDFFLYKEDIELSLRIRKNGWSLVYDPRLIAYHCRGWSKRRDQILYQTKLLASSNEILLYKKHPSPYMLWAIMKYLLVKFFKV
jgi:N-acetylglucosaminyl-diphospho-decaprenol L-rhamnosyltransferase